jgi:hypothetical protein
MNYGDCKAHFKALLNRTDCTDALTVTLFKQATTRIQRSLRVPMMEKIRVVKAEGPLTNIQLPSDYLELKEILVDMNALEKVSSRALLGMSKATGTPQYYSRISDRMVIAPAAQKGSEVVILYYGEFANLPADGSTNGLTEAAPDLLVYGALSLAGDYFEHDKRAEWEGRYQDILASVQQQAIDDEFNGGAMVVQSAYQDY